MGNTQKLGKPVIPAGDYGLGLCLQCIGEMIIDPDGAPQPQFAVTLAPLPQPQGVISAPACFEHVRQSVSGQPAVPGRKPMLVATGSLPKGLPR